MKRFDLERLRDAGDFARYAQGNASGLSADVLADAMQPQHAALFDLIIIGETLNGVSAEVKSAAPDLPWQAMVDLHPFVVHAYWQVDFEIIADVIEKPT
ncbi:MAG: DUF86 domain-containing protein [Rhizobiales bacterium]|nr:DUF86 domain-containing protein [Hyphomicrobiales bacterium]